MVRSVEVQPTSTVDDALLKLAVFFHAGMEAEAMAALRGVRETQPKLFRIEDLLRDALRTKQLHLARTVLEMYGDVLRWPEPNTPPSLEDFLIGPLLTAGWSVERMDRWLAALPRGQDDFILIERLKFALAHGRGESLMKELSAATRANPAEIRSARVMIVALGWPSTPPSVREKWPTTWMPDVIQPRLATDAAKLGELFDHLGQPVAALHFLTIATKLPFTQEDVPTFRSIQRSGPSFEGLHKGFLRDCLHEMASCWTALHEPEKAEELERAASKASAEQVLERGARPSGNEMARGPSEAPHTLAALEAQEAVRRDDPDYWLQQAYYYQELKDVAKIEEALKRGLAVALPTADNFGIAKGEFDQRCALLHEYARFLDGHGRANEGIEMLWREFREAPVNAASRRAALEFLMFLYHQRLSATDERLWQWLNDHVKWGYTEESLLKAMFRHAPADLLSRLVARCERMTEDAPARALILGGVLVELHQSAAGIRQLEQALAKTTDRDLAWNARAKLFECAANSGDWRKTETLFPQYMKDHSIVDGSPRFGRLALVAARAGAKADAVRLWTAAVCANPWEMTELKQIAELGLKKELAEIYLTLHRSLPTSVIPRRAFQLIGADATGRIPSTKDG